MEEIKNHIMNGYHFLRSLQGRFNFTAEIILYHHCFQKDSYPKELLSLSDKYSEETKAMIVLYSRILALADCYESLHRILSRFYGTFLRRI